MRKILTFLLLAMLLPSVVMAQGGSDIDTVLPLGNNKWLSAGKAGNPFGENRLLRSDTSDNTEVNAPTGSVVEMKIGDANEILFKNDEIEFAATGKIDATTSIALAISNTAEVTVSNDTLTFSGAAASVVGGATSLTVGSSGSTIIKATADANRLFTFDASSDTALTQTFGDAGVTAAQDFTIGASTADADDDSRLILAGGANNSSSRGGFIVLQGNEASGAGDVQLQSGAAAGSDVIVGLNNSATAFVLRNSAGSASLQYTEATTTTPTLKFGDAGVTAAQVFAISATTADADDDSGIQLNSGGSNAVSRGAYVSLYGNESANTGLAQLTSGNVANSAVYIDGGHSGSPINFRPGGGSTTYWQMTSTGTLIGAGTGSAGWSVVAGANTACTTTCTAPAVFGLDGTTLVGPSDATADICLCAGAS